MENKKIFKQATPEQLAEMRNQKREARKKLLEKPKPEIEITKPKKKVQFSFTQIILMIDRKSVV